MKDVWASAERYERYVGRWSRLVAREFVAWLGLRGGAWLDVGCGTGALAATVAALAAPRRVVGVDPSPAFAAQALANIGPAVAVADARALPFAPASFDASVAGLVLNFVPDPPAALREMRRVVRPSGAVAAYVWDYAGEMQLMRRFWDAAVALDPAALDRDEAPRFPICAPGPLGRAFEGAGLERVEVRAIDVPTVFRDFDDYWTPFLGGTGPAPAYAMSLSEDARVRLRERLRETLPARADGSIALVARAWAARGVVGAGRY